MSKLHQARFFTTVNELQTLPQGELPEIAFAGRSNAGKSSAINILCNQKRLAFASKTPGRTQHINYFGIYAKDELLAYLVDLPGYGYAAVGEATRSHWNEILSRYLQTRKNLVGLILIVDARRGLTELDEQMIAWFSVTQKPIHILLSKSDKQTFSENRALLQAISEQIKQFAPAEITAQLFSSTKRVGLSESDTLIQQWLFPERNIA
ncbi:MULTISPECIES: ribosome biogenesis GTP-binding protein YihA/YsxC [unclassified Polynucleobacter]|uniref:ribosome biogenesis GTP-binding protein YihA/YsxC n=1 Tax=unclassified Polynucleobacter TaxID=2640945 RepID=UPI002573EE27|nr:MULTISPECIES: ribosome biogenesis GTP-binding protein YihA/YsxC [unclassified Polynucleobacter]BEI40140.1 ribosome biogenesis GTP-binding protein YihA/YsxC [Polynucleobacter sp. HIN9]BEI41922.1 ribosome biogenesis GTP-binding protein YihA/YsxC [Polynucleobacter sp. HIN10]BEI43699.1 ribosome biogenesis GTP-binding protein YihA/YsxC [Polynucleobacter sp. HIN11]